MRYQLCPGVVKTQICGVNLLMRTRAAAVNNIPARHLNLLEAFCVEAVIKQLPPENLEKAFQILTKKEDNDIRQMIDEMHAKLIEEGWIAAEDAQ